nr:10659_t:CDS:2 [Entrophospora candida]
MRETEEQIRDILGIKNQEFLQALTKKISEYQTIIIHRHISPDGDAYGAQIGLKSGKSGQLKGYREGIFDRLEYFQDSADKAKEEDYRDALVITVDTSIKEPLALSQNLSIPQKASKALYHGMVTDTNRFHYISEKEDGEKTLTIAGMMLSKSNFDLLSFYKGVHPLSTVEETRVKGFIMSNFKIDNGKVWLFIKPSDFHEQDGVTEDGKIRASLRSESIEYPVNKIAQNFGGSGHIRAAGLKLPKDD